MIEIDLCDDLEGKTKKEARSYLKTFYDSAYKSGTYKPINSYGSWARLFKGFSPFVKNKKPFNRALEVGCGIGIGVSLANMLGHNAWGIDLANASSYWKSFGIGDKCLVASALNIPFKDNMFDFILCSDVMEHIPENDVIDVFKEILRVGSKFFFFIIHTSMEAIPLKIIKNDEEIRISTHITQHSPGWWANKLSVVGYQNIDLAVTPKHVVIICSKNKENKEWRT